MRYFILFFSFFITLSSCDNAPEEKLIDGSRTYISLDKNEYSLSVNENSNKILSVVVFSSTVSSLDRLFNVVLDQQKSNALPENYSYDASFVIPANSYQGTFNVTGIDDDNLDFSTSKELYFDITSNFEFDSDNTTVFVDLKQYIEFSGLYLIEQTSQDTGFGDTLSSGTVVNVQAPLQNERSFFTLNFPNGCEDKPQVEFLFNVDYTNKTLDVPFQNTTCPCNNATNYFGPATTASIFDDASNDASFNLTFTEDAQLDCGTAFQTIYKFTKQ